MIIIKKLTKSLSIWKLFTERNRLPVLKEVYIKEFLQLGCDISKDKSEVHPPKLCNKHKAVLIRVRNVIEENREFRLNITTYVYSKNILKVVKYAITHLILSEERENVHQKQVPVEVNLIRIM